MKPAPAAAPRYVGLDTAAASLEVSRKTIERAIRAGRLPVKRIGRRVLVDPSDLPRLFGAPSRPRPSAG